MCWGQSREPPPRPQPQRHPAHPKEKGDTQGITHRSVRTHTPAHRGSHAPACIYTRDNTPLPSHVHVYTPGQTDTVACPSTPVHPRRTGPRAGAGIQTRHPGRHCTWVGCPQVGDMLVHRPPHRHTQSHLQEATPAPQQVLPTKPYPSDFFFMAGTISVSISTFRSNFSVKHSLLGS